MKAFLSKSLNLGGFTGANLNFWYVIPSLEAGFDHLDVYLDSDLLWTTAAAQATWTPVTLPLNSYLGGAHALKFEFDSDGSIVREGAYLDDILVRASTQSFAASLLSVANINYTGYVLASDTLLGRSNIQGQAVFQVENFTGTNTTYTNVLSFRLINADDNTPHPLYDFGNANTNADYTYNITNVLSLA